MPGKRIDPKDYIGKRYGRWVIKKHVGMVGRVRKFTCKCDCGTVSDVTFSNMQSGLSTGCNKCQYRTGNIIHGGTGTPLYNKWTSMSRRYGVCKEWEDFAIFREFVGNRMKFAIIDMSKPLSPDNITFEFEHASRLATINGVTKPRSQWVKELGVSRERVRQLSNANEGKCICGKERTPGFALCGACAEIRGMRQVFRRDETAVRAVRTQVRTARARITWIKDKIASYQEELQRLEAYIDAKTDAA